MLSANTSYRLGTRALVYMIIERLRYPFYLAAIMVGVSLVLYFLHTPLLSSYEHGSSIVRFVPKLVYGIEKYGWAFTSFLIIFLGLSVVPEYLGLAFRLDKDAVYLRYGILTYNEIAVPYKKIIEIDVAQNRWQKILGLSSFFMKTDQTHKTTGKKIPREAGFSQMHASLAQELGNTISRAVE